MKVARRGFVKGATSAGALAAFGLGYGPVVMRMFSGTSGTPTDPDAVVGPEGYLYSACLQCNTGCGIKVKVVDGEAVKIEGNPYSPFNRFPHLAYGTAVGAAVNEFGALCPKGQAGLQTAYDPYRLREGPKRAGPRGPAPPGAGPPAPRTRPPSAPRSTSSAPPARRGRRASRPRTTPTGCGRSSSGRGPAARTAG